METGLLAKRGIRMVAVREGGIGLRWGAIFAGAVVAMATAWVGELMGGLLGLIEPGESSGWSWAGGLLTLAITLVGAFAGGWIAARIAGLQERSAGLLHGVVVWGLLGTSSALLFAILGGNIALVIGATAGALRMAIGFAMVVLLGALLAAAAGGAMAAGAQPGRGLRRGVPAAGGRRQMGATRPSAERGPERVGPGTFGGDDVPPSVH